MIKGTKYNKKMLNRILSFIVSTLILLPAAVNVLALAMGQTQPVGTVVGWTWVDEDEMLVMHNGRWELALPGTSADNPVTQEILAGFLPEQITAMVLLPDEDEEEPEEEELKGEIEDILIEIVEEDAEGADEPPASPAKPVYSEETLTVAWDLNSLPQEGAYEGEYTFTASLPEDYVLAEDAEPLEATVVLGGTSVMAAQPGYTVSSLGTVPGIDVPNSKVNIFDYWIHDSSASADTSNPSGYILNKGINNAHAFIFTNGSTGCY